MFSRATILRTAHAETRRRIEQTEALRPGVKCDRGEHREYRPGQAEDHRGEIHCKAPKDHRLAHRELEAADDRRHRPLALRR